MIERMNALACWRAAASGRHSVKRCWTQPARCRPPPGQGRARRAACEATWDRLSVRAGRKNFDRIEAQHLCLAAGRGKIGRGYERTAAGFGDQADGNCRSDHADASLGWRVFLLEFPMPDRSSGPLDEISFFRGRQFISGPDTLVRRLGNRLSFTNRHNGLDDAGLRFGIGRKHVDQFVEAGSCVIHGLVSILPVSMRSMMQGKSPEGSIA